MGVNGRWLLLLELLAIGLSAMGSICFLAFMYIDISGKIEYRETMLAVFSWASFSLLLGLLMLFLNIIKKESQFSVIRLIAVTISSFLFVTAGSHV